MTAETFTKKIIEDYGFSFERVKGNCVFFLNKEKSSRVLLEFVPAKDRRNDPYIEYKVSVVLFDKLSFGTFLIQDLTLDKINLEEDGSITVPKESRMTLFEAEKDE